MMLPLPTNSTAGPDSRRRIENVRWSLKKDRRSWKFRQSGAAQSRHRPARKDRFQAHCPAPKTTALSRCPLVPGRQNSALHPGGLKRPPESVDAGVGETESAELQIVQIGRAHV